MNRRSKSAKRGEASRTNRSAFEFALIRLARRAHSEGELISKMERAGYVASDVTDTISELRRRRYVDDSSFAVAFAQGTRRHRHWGPIRIAQGLRRRGLSEPDIERAVAEAFPDGEAESAEEVLARFRRTERGRRGTSLQRKARAYRHLYARGFSPEAIRHALNQHDGRGSSPSDRTDVTHERRTTESRTTR